MTPAVVAAVDAFNKLAEACDKAPALETDPSLEQPVAGQPISHTQLIEISHALRAQWQPSGATHERFPHSLELLLRGCDVYQPPKPPKKEPVSYPSVDIETIHADSKKTNEYKALMARLRREQEEREYWRMTSQGAQAADVQMGIKSRMPMDEMTRNDDDDEMTFADVNRQLTLIINVVVTVLACGVGIWLVASRWGAASRLAVSMGGGGLIGVAEVVIYAGYIRRLGEAKRTERKVVERKSVESSWVIEGRAASGRASERIGLGDGATGHTITSDNVRRRPKMS